MTAFYAPPLPASRLFASQQGVTLDGATDMTAKVQAILDSYGSAGKPLHLIIDGNILLTREETGSG